MQDIWLYILPAALVLIICIYYFERALGMERSRQKFEQLREAKKNSYPMQIQAYERLTLYMERINPESLIPRLISAESSAIAFQNTLISAIREEFEHNLSQQLYVSNNAWLLVVKAKESITQLVNVSMAELPQNGTAIDLSKNILQAHASVKKSPTSVAITALKEEFTSIL